MDSQAPEPKTSTADKPTGAESISPLPNSASIVSQLSAVKPLSRELVDQPPAIPDYQLLQRIGGGSYGEVWLARSATGALRALKIVWRHTFDDERPFQREFEGIQCFERLSRQHPSQLALFHVGRGEGYFFYVMELADDACQNPNPEVRNPKEVRNPNAETPLANNAVPSVLSSAFDIRHSALYVPHTLRADLAHGRLPAARVLEIGLTLTSALHALHEAGLVHRDIKPSNIIFVGGRPKLADIGLVTDTGDARSIVGTEGYLAPEGPGSPQADIFALGKVLYEAATRLDRRQFPQLPTDLRAWPDAALVFELNEILLKACAADARERYQSADQMRADLELLRAGRSVKRRQAWQETRRLTLRLGAAAAVVIAAWLLFNRVHDSTRQRSNAATPAASIFVLPFRNDGTNQVDEILRSRITDAVIDGLALIDGVKVGPRRIGLQHLSEEEARRQALKEFNARNTLAGTVRTSGEQVSIALGFHESAQNRLLWSESFAGALTNLALIESQVVRRIAASLGTPLQPEREQEVSTKLSRNLAAYELYQRVFGNGEPRGSEHFVRSQMIVYLKQALDLDANFVQAHTASALVHRMAAYSDCSPREAMIEVQNCARRAIAIDPSFADGHYWLAGARIGLDYDWSGYEAELRRAFDLAPGQHGEKALYYRCLGHNDAARAEQQKYLDQSPPWGSVPDESFSQFVMDEQYERALELCRDMARKEPNEPTWQLCFGQCYRRMGRYEDALKELEKARPRWNPPILLAEIGMVYALMGRSGDALATLQKMEEQAANRYTPPYFKAQIHAALGDKQRALGELERAYEDRCEQLVNVDFSWGLRTDPSWKGMESEPRFVALLKKVGLDVWPR